MLFIVTYLHTFACKLWINNSCACGLQLEEAEKRLKDTELKLANIRGRRRDSSAVVKSSPGNGMKEVKVEKRSPSPAKISVGTKLSRSHEKLERETASPLQRSKFSSENVPQSKPLLVIPPIEPKISQPMKIKEAGYRVSSSSGSRPDIPSPSRVSGIVRMKEDRSRRESAEQNVIESQSKGMKRKLGSTVISPTSFHFILFQCVF